MRPHSTSANGPHMLGIDCGADLDSPDIACAFGGPNAGILFDCSGASADLLAAGGSAASTVCPEGTPGPTAGAVAPWLVPKKRPRLTDLDCAMKFICGSCCFAITGCDPDGGGHDGAANPSGDDDPDGAPLPSDSGLLGGTTRAAALPAPFGSPCTPCIGWPDLKKPPPPPAAC